MQVQVCARAWKGCGGGGGLGGERARGDLPISQACFGVVVVWCRTTCGCGVGEGDLHLKAEMLPAPPLFIACLDRFWLFSRGDRDTGGLRFRLDWIDT